MKCPECNADLPEGHWGRSGWECSACGKDGLWLDREQTQIVLVDEDMPEDQEYGPYRGFVLEYAGQYVEDSDCVTLDEAKALAAAKTGSTPADWRFADQDGRGVQVWGTRPAWRLP